MEIDKPIEYESNNPKENIKGLVVLGVIAVFFIFHFYTVLTGSPTSSDWVGAAIFIGFMALVIGMFVYTSKRGLRFVNINNSSVTLTYPHDKIQMGVSQITAVHTRRRKDDGKLKGSVRFVGTDGNKYAIRFTLQKPGGTEAFEWFEKLEQEQKQQTEAL